MIAPPGPPTPIPDPRRFPCDTHTHTARCGHAEGSDEAFVEAAIGRGLAALAITEHVPFYWLPPEAHDPRLAMAADELPRYVDDVLALKSRYAGRVEVLVGLEADYIPGHEDTLASLLASYPFDVVLGSVHWVDGWIVDAPPSVARYRQGQGEVDAIWAGYAGALLGAIACGLFDVLSHLDLPKKFGFRPSAPFAGRQREIVAALAASGCAVELSSAGRRKPVGEDYPAPDLMRELAGAGVPFVLSSDAHTPAEVAFAFAELVPAARKAGIGEVAVYRRRRRSMAALPHVG
jgi:histidinol-phosphatase (PHP family)